MQVLLVNQSWYVVLKRSALNLYPDMLKVTWDGPSDPANPRNWPKDKKWVTTILASLYTFNSPVASSMIAPALDEIGRDLGVSSDLQQYLLLSIFILAYSIGPLILGPLSETYGRSIVLTVSNIVFFCLQFGMRLCPVTGANANVPIFEWLRRQCSNVTGCWYPQ